MRGCIADLAPENMPGSAKISRKLITCFLIHILMTEKVCDSAWNRRFFIDKFDNCASQKNYMSSLRNVKISYPKNRLLLDYEIVTTKASKQNLWYKQDIIRCANKENPDTCIKIKTVVAKDCCKLFESSGMGWTDMVDCLTPTLSCPIPKGTHTGRNCSVDTASFNFFPMGNAYWKFHGIIYEGKEQVRFCIDMACYMKEY